MSSPRAFISYSWSSQEHEQWVVDLATQLTENGVDVVLDKWDLKEGHDPIVFMEKMVVDPTIEKVIIVSDRVYARKADDRQAGVGAETQIITPQIYAKADQDKFVAVLSEVNADGKGFLPVYYGSRIFIDLSRDEIYSENFVQLVRWIYNKPAFPKPRLGKPPAFLDEATVLLPTKSRASRAIDLIQKGSSLSESATSEYLETLVNSFSDLEIDTNAEPLDDEIIRSIQSFLPYRDEFVKVINTLSTQELTDKTISNLIRFFETALTYCFRGRDVTSWSDEWFDNYRFIVHELFLSLAAILIKREQFSALNQLLLPGFYVGKIDEYANDPLQQFDVIRIPLRSFDTRNRRLSLNRSSVQADILRDRWQSSLMTFDDIMLADFVLYVRDSIAALRQKRRNAWFPVTLVYVGRHKGLEPFVRSRSASYFAKFKLALGVRDKSDLATLLSELDGNVYRPSWAYYPLPVASLIALDSIGTAS